MITPGIYDIPADEYFADPCPEPSLSNSIGKILLNQSPAHAYAAHPRLGASTEYKRSKAMTLGSAAHSVILEGSWEPIVSVDADDFRTKDAREARDAVRPFRFSQAGAEYGELLVERAVTLWAACMDEDRWPSYDTSVMTVETPYWITRELEAE